MSLAPTISWDPNQESDLAGYRIYIGLTPGVYSSFIDVLLPCRTWLKLMGLAKYAVTYLTVTAFDTSNNEGAFGAEVSTIVTGGLILK